MSDRYYQRTVKDSSAHRILIMESYSHGDKLTRQTVSIGSEGIKNIFIMDYDKNLKVNITYDKFAFSNDLIFPGKIDLLMFAQRNIIELRLKYGQTIFNEPLKVKFETPVNYSQTVL